MRILQVGSSLFEWGGIERYICYLATGLEDLGHVVDVSRPARSPLADRFPGGISISAPRKLSARASANYLRLFRRRHYDIVHVHFNPDFLSVGFAARIAKVPKLVMTRHVAIRWPQWKARTFSSLYDRIIPVSDAVKLRLIESGVPESMISVAKAGCPALVPSEDRGATRRSLGIQSDGFAVGAFGRLVPEKGLDILLRAAPKVAGNVSFEIFGAGPLEQELIQQANGIANVRLHGFRSEIANCMDAMDAVVIPSRWDEPFPYAALEAMSLGLPLIVSRTGGLIELVNQGVNGLGFDRERVDGLVEAVRELSASPAETLKMGSNGKEIHRSQFTVEKMSRRIESVYQS